MDRITVYRSCPYVIQKKPSADETVISAQELRGWIGSGKIFSQFFRYRKSAIFTYDLRFISKPFISTLLIWLLSRKESMREDVKGAKERITLRLLGSLFGKLLKDLLAKKKFLREVQKEVDSLEAKSAVLKVDFSRPPLYLRTDFCFGLQSGGSVGHIAGVLNQLGQFTAPPLFFSSDQIPTVDPALEMHIIFPENSFWDFNELPFLQYNGLFCRKVIEQMQGRKPSFIYQRYSVHNFAGIQIAKHYRVPFVLEYNGSEIWVNRHWGSSALTYERLAEQIELTNFRSANLIVVVSKPLKDQLIEKGIEPEKILVNPNGVDPEKYSPQIEGSSIREKLQVQNKVVLGFIGTFGRWHGAEVLVEAFGKLLAAYPEWRGKAHLLMVGDGLTMPVVKERLAKWNLFDEVTLPGTVPQEVGPSYLAACDLLISPHVPNADGSPFFGSPTKLFEYMAMGKGIVASDLNQIGEVLTHNRSAWMVKPGDSDSLMEGMKILIEDPLLRARLGQAARQDVLSHHTWKEHTRKIIKALHG